MRAAIRIARKYTEQIRLLGKNRINTDTELKSFIANRKDSLGDLERQRGKVYNRMKSAKTPDDLEKLKAERDILSGDIKTIRKELFHANDILKRSKDIEKQLRIEMNLRSEQLNNDKNKNRKQELIR